MKDMADFIAELRPSTRPVHTFDYPEGFVAELRPRRCNTLLDVPVGAGCKSLSDQRCDVSFESCKKAATEQSDYSDRDVLHALSEKKFTKESITSLLENSIVTLIEKMLINQTICRIHGTVKVVLNDDDMPITLDLNRNFAKPSGGDYIYLTELDTDLNVKVRDEPAARDNESQSKMAGEKERTLECLQVKTANLSGEEKITEDGSRQLCSPPYEPDSSTNLSPLSESGCTETVREAKKRRFDSDDESGYTSKEDQDAMVDEASNGKNVDSATTRRPMFNDYFCSGFDGSETLYEPESRGPGHKKGESYPSDDDRDEMTDNDEDETAGASRLIIDENAQIDDEAELGMDTEDDRRPTEVKTFQREPLNKPFGEQSESEEFESLISSDFTDVDTVDLSGDSDLPRGLSSILLHRHSIFAKHPDGLKCKECSMIIAEGEDVAKHALENHNLFTCSYCSRTFTAKNNLKRHVRMHTGSRPYKCLQCHETFARRDDLKNHVLRHNYNKPYRCSICHKGYTDRACVKNHMAKEHNSRMMRVCPNCGESFDRDDFFTQHKKTHPELQQFSCKKCSFIGNNKLMTLKHNLLHTHKLFSCKPCNAYFADPFDYTEHVRKHKKTLSFSEYICCFCNVSLSTYEQYVRHEYSHAQGKNHTCKTCRRQFKSRSHLSEHWQTQHEEQAENLENDSRMSETAKVPRTSDHVPRPEMETIVEEAEYDEYSGQLLDLSMKKPSGGSFEFDRKASGLTTDVPRNGYVNEPFAQRSDVQAAFVYKPQYVEEKTYRPVFNIHRDNGVVGSKRPELPRHETPRFVPMVLPVDRHAPGFERSCLPSKRTPPRFEPYKKLDFMSKFMAIRGSQIAGAKQNISLAPIERLGNAAPVLLNSKDSTLRQIIERSCPVNKKPITSNVGSSIQEPIPILPVVVKAEASLDSEMKDLSISSPARSPKSYEETSTGAAARSINEARTQHVCDLCKEKFNSFPDLEAHSLDVHKKYLCPHNCNKTFTTRPNRDRHARTHTGERPYKCDLCPAAFFRGDDLKYHRTTRHASDKPHVCNRCSQTFPWGRDLDRHKKNSKCKA